MPTYEYRCAKCGEHLEVHQSFSEEPLTRHARCGGKLTKVLSAAGIVLKGSGFYKTDNRSSATPSPSTPPSTSTPSEPGPSSPSSAEPQREGKGTEAKSA